MKDDYWIVRDDIGIKCFPRAGSTTILTSYGYNQSFDAYMRASRKYVVVRDPVARLWSALQLYKTNRYTNVPEVAHLNDLMQYIVERPQEDCDNHCRSMTAQLGGWKPRLGEVVEMGHFLSNPVLTINPAHRGLRRRVSHAKLDLAGVDKDLFKEWIGMYRDDVELYRAATKA